MGDHSKAINGKHWTSSLVHVEYDETSIIARHEFFKTLAPLLNQFDPSSASSIYDIPNTSPFLSEITVGL